MIIGSIMIGPWLIGDIYEASYIGALIFLGGASIILLQIIPRLLTKYSITYDEFYDADKASLTIIIYMLLTPVGMMCTEIFVYFGKW